MGQNVLIGDSPQSVYFGLNKPVPDRYILTQTNLSPIDRCPQSIDVPNRSALVAPLPEEMLAQQEQQVKADPQCGQRD